MGKSLYIAPFGEWVGMFYLDKVILERAAAVAEGYLRVGYKLVCSVVISLLVNVLSCC